MSSSCPWLPSSVLDRKGAKSTKISLSSGATFSRARSSLVVMLWREVSETKDEGGREREEKKNKNNIRMRVEERVRGDNSGEDAVSGGTGGAGKTCTKRKEQNGRKEERRARGNTREGNRNRKGR